MITVIIADPAWKFGDRLTKRRGAEAHYGCMTTAEIAALPVARRTAGFDGAVLAMWCPSSMLEDGLTVMRAWGFDLKQTYVWVKTCKNRAGPRSGRRMRVERPRLGLGMGRLFRNCHEIALIGTRGKVYGELARRNVRTVEMAWNAGHSIKPEGLAARLESMFPDAVRLEMFARRTRPGWECLGNEIDGRDLRDSL